MYGALRGFVVALPTALLAGLWFACAALAFGGWPGWGVVIGLAVMALGVWAFWGHPE